MAVCSFTLPSLCKTCLKQKATLANVATATMLACELRAGSPGFCIHNFTDTSYITFNTGLSPVGEVQVQWQKKIAFDWLVKEDARFGSLDCRVREQFQRIFTGCRPSMRYNETDRIRRIANSIWFASFWQVHYCGSFGIGSVAIGKTCFPTRFVRGDFRWKHSLFWPSEALQMVITSGSVLTKI